MLGWLFFSTLAAQQVLPGVEQFGRGVDLAFSNPNGAGGADPGLRLNIFQMQSYASNTTFNGQYLIPDGISVRPAPGCSYNSKVTVIHDTQDYQEDITIRSKTTHRFLRWSHSSTQEYNYVQQKTQNSENVIIQARAECSAYSTHLNFYTLSGANLSPSFVLAVQQLPSAWDPSKLFPWADFVQKFGTHFMAEAVMGGTAQQSSVFTSKSFSSLVQQGTDLHNAAALDFLKLFGGDLWVNRSKNYRDYQQFASLRLEASPPLWIPQMPPSSPNVAMSGDAWAQQIQLPNGNPGLISYSLQELPVLLTSQFFNVSSEPNLAAKAKYLSYYIENVYCLSTGLSCAPPVINPTWNSDVLALLAPRARHCTVAIDETVYVLGGVEDPASNTPFVANVFNLHEDQQWELISSLNIATDADCAVLNGRIYMVGGNVGGKPTGATAAYDPSIREWILDQGQLNVPRFGLTVQVSGGRLFAVGGKQTAALATVERYDPITNSWEVRASMPTARFGLSSVAYGNQIIVVGGSVDGNVALNAVELYDSMKDRWTVGPSPIPVTCFPRFNHRTLLVDDPILGPLVYMMGGMSAGQALSDVSVYDPVRFTWTHTNWDMPAQRSSGGLVQLGQATEGFELHWIGGSSAGTPYDSHWVLQLPPSGRTNESSNFVPSDFSDVSPRPTQDVSLAPLPIFPAIDYLSYGYNILRGDPLTSSSDPGWTSQGPFQVACSECFKAGRSFLGQYLIPDGVSVEKLETCSYDAESFVSHSELDLQATLSAFVDGRAHAGIPLLFHLRFKASIVATVGTVSKGELDVSMVGATATCEAYRVMLNSYTPNIVLRDDFVQGVASLPSVFDTNNPWPWYDFVEAFGTHYVSALTLGGRATQLSTVESEDLYYLQTQNVDLDACAKASFLNLFGASMKVTGSMSSRSYELLTQYTASNYSFCSPACPTRSADISANATAWAQSVQLPSGTPVPIKSVLVEITQLLNASLFPAAMKAVVENQRTILIQFLNSTNNSSYCYLMGVCTLPSSRPLWNSNPQLQLMLNRSQAIVGLLDEVLVVSSGITTGPSPSAAARTLATQILPLSGNSTWGTIEAFPGIATVMAASVTSQSRLMVFGGEDTNGLPVTDAWAFTLSGRWTRLASLPVALTRSASVASGTLVYLLGGISLNKQFSTTVYIYNAQADTWSSGINTFPPRASPAAASLGGDIFVCGGYLNTGSLVDVVVYHTDSDTWDAIQLSLPYPLFGAAVVPLSDRFLIVGGTRSDLTKKAAPSGDVYTYQPKDSAWTALPSLPFGLTNPGAFLLNQTLYVVGGTSASITAVGSVYSLDLTTFVPSQQHLNALPTIRPPSVVGPVFTPATERPKHASAANIFPLVDFAAHGYNRVRGSPLTSGRDEGWAIQPVLDLACATCFSKGNLFQGYAVPDVLQVDPLSSCDYSASSALVRDSFAFQQLLRQQVSFDDDVPVPILEKLEFSASARLKEFSSVSVNARAGLAIARGRCEMYSMLLDDVQLSDLHFTDNFIAGLLSLPTIVTKDTLQPFFEFIETFGTHLPTQLTLGGEMAQVSEFADVSLTQLFTLDVDVIGASHDSLLVFFGVSISGGALAHFSDYLRFSASYSDNSTNCKPRCPPSGPDVNSNTGPWIQALSIRPGINGTTPTSVPIGMRLTALTDLMASLLTPLAARRIGARPAFSDTPDLLLRLKSAQQNLQQFLNTEYCGMVDGCGVPAALAQWQPARQLDPPIAVSFAASAQTNTTLFLAGGADIKNNLLSTFLSFDVLQQKWSYAPPLPEPRSQASAAVIGDLLYLVGGYVGKTSSASVRSFRLSSGTWSNQTASMQTPRACFAMAMVNGFLFAAGGFNGSVSEATIEVYDTQANAWSWFPAKLSVARHAAAVAVSEALFYVVGGASGASSTFVNCVEAVNTQTGTVSVLLPLPAPRAFASAFASSFAISVVGGMTQAPTGVTFANVMTVWDAAQNAWYEGPSSIYTRAGASAFQTSSAWLLFGGYNATATAMGASVERLLV